MQLKKYLTNNILVLVLTLTALTKIAEWLVQYFTFPEFVIGLENFWYIQFGFILTVAVILFVGFKYSKVKSKTYLLIPVLAYFIKELYNFLFVYGRILNSVTLIALVIEPLLIYGMIQTLNKYWLKLN